ncbi:DNA helicase rad5 [Rhizoclosmatium sp. JEL0117]|nr:DNA helicase rad5 [Rhizoclosmatium sp. JEL0117]
MISSKEFLISRVRRNDPEIHYPPPIYETIRVTQTAMEMSLYRSSATNNNRANMENLVKLCNHYQIGNNLFSETGSEALTIEQVTQRVQTDRSTKINQLTKQIENHVKVIERRREVLNKAVDYQVRQAAELSYRKALTEDCQMKEELRSTQSQFNFFQNFLNSYGSEDNKIFCSVCWDDDIPKDGLALVPCGHVFCWECAEGVANRNQKCPQCMMPIRRDQLMKLQPPTAALEAPEPSAEQKENDDGDKLDPDKFGSKIRELVEYLQREMAENDNNRFLVFIQWSDLADLVSQALNTFGIATARLKSGWTQREAALKQFRAGLPESSFAKDDQVEAEAKAEAECDEEKIEEIAELKPKAVKVKPVKKDVKGKNRAVPLDLDLTEVQPLPPRRATRKAKATAIIGSESEEPEPKEDVAEIKKRARRATSSKARPAKKQRKKADDSEDDFGVGSDDGDVQEDDEFDESAVVSKTSKKRPVLNDVESKSVKREQKYKAVKVLMLSAKDSVSGLNLTEATHCIIMHPFHDNKEDYAIGAEKQGIARTLRNGQTKTVKIVRFVVERTVEQEMHDRRVDKLKD